MFANLGKEMQISLKIAGLVALRLCAWNRILRTESFDP